MSPKKLLVLGASGNTGQHLVTQALERDHVVTALVRARFYNHDFIVCELNLRLNLRLRQSQNFHPVRGQMNEPFGHVGNQKKSLSQNLFDQIRIKYCFKEPFSNLLEYSLKCFVSF